MPRNRSLRSWKWKFWWLLPCLLCLAWLWGGGDHRAAAARPSNMAAAKSSAPLQVGKTDPDIVRVGVYILSVGNLDMTTGGYTSTST